MILRFHCNECFENGNKNIYGDLPLNNDYIYNYVCEYGHSKTFWVQNFKFDLLFDSAINALNDGYFREAISSFYASLENFYIEMTEQLLIKSEFKINKDAYLETFKSRINLSERKIAAFYTIFLILMNETPPAFSSDSVSFRNKVIHGTHFPDKMETLRFAYQVRDYIFKIWEKIETKHSDLYMGSVYINIFKGEVKPDYITSKHRCYLSQYAVKYNKPAIDIIYYETNLKLYKSGITE